MVCILAYGPSCPWFNSQHSQTFWEEKIINVAEVNQGRWLDKSGLWLKNVDRTHLALASGKPVPKNCPTDIWLTEIWPTDAWPSNIWPSNIWPTDIWPTDIWPTVTLPTYLANFFSWPTDTIDKLRVADEGLRLEHWCINLEVLGSKPAELTDIITWSVRATWSGGKGQLNTEMVSKSSI